MCEISEQWRKPNREPHVFIPIRRKQTQKVETMGNDKRSKLRTSRLQNSRLYYAAKPALKLRQNSKQNSKRTFRLNRFIILNFPVYWYRINIGTNHHKMGGCAFHFRYGSWKFSSNPFLLSAFSIPGVHLASNGNECRGVSLGVKCGRCVELTTLPT
jgi:hypothetical protein